MHQSLTSEGTTQKALVLPCAFKFRRPLFLRRDLAFQVLEIIIELRLGTQRTFIIDHCPLVITRSKFNDLFTRRREIIVQDLQRLEEKGIVCDVLRTVERRDVDG